MDSLCGYASIALTEFTTSASCSIAGGSKLEVAGAFFNFISDTAPSASSWSSVATATTAYIACIPSGTAGSQILSLQWTSVAPFFRTDLGAWYASAGSTTRVVASVYKGESTSYWYKKVLHSYQDTSGNDLYDRKGNLITAHGATTFTISGTFSAPVTTVYITGCGGGAAGTAGHSGGWMLGGAGGNAGSYIYKKTYTITPNETLTITIGAAGGNVTVSSTSIALTLTAGAAISAGNGGAGGTAGQTGANGGYYGGAGGAGTGSTGASGGGGGAGAPGIFGNYDNLATSGSTGSGDGGAGGAAGYGGGGGGGYGTNGGAGGAGKCGGGGGGGGGAISSGGAGGAGSQGVVIIEW